PFTHTLPSRIRSVDLAAFMPVHPLTDGIPGSHQTLRAVACGAMVTCVIASSTVLVSLFLDLWRSLPPVTPQSLRAEQSIVLLDRAGRELYRVYDKEDRVAETDLGIPAVMKQAIIAIEDARFDTRGCIDLRAVARAA